MATEERILQVVLSIQEDVAVLKKEVACLTKSIGILDAKLEAASSNVNHGEPESRWYAVYDSMLTMWDIIRKMQADAVDMRTQLENDKFQKMRIQFFGDSKTADVKLSLSEKSAKLLAELEQLYLEKKV